jgi:GGDEF domain-containing protein
MVFTALQNQFYRTYWVGAWAAMLLSMLSSILHRPVDGWSLGWHLLLTAITSAVCIWWLPRQPDHATGVFMLAGLLLTTFFTSKNIHVWNEHGIGPIIFAVISTPFMLGLSLAWRWPGAAIGGIGSVFIGVLLTRTWLEITLTIVSLLVATALGLLLHEFFRTVRRQQRALERSVSMDLLTKIGNRRALLNDFERFQKTAQQQGIPLLLTSWDVDGLKRINDTKGHEAGDHYILEFVQALRNAVRTGDGLYRVGGDEFIGLHVGLSGGETLYTRVRTNFNNVSGGWVRATRITLDQAMREADVQMYNEKREHKARVTRILGDSTLT